MIALPPPIVPLPPILRGVPELTVHLKLPDQFVAAWLDNCTASIPRLPHILAGGTRIFQTAHVLAWLDAHHSSAAGAELKSTGQPPTRRANPFKKGKPGTPALTIHAA